jgi:hypothetical protein
MVLYIQHWSEVCEGDFTWIARPLAAPPETNNGNLKKIYGRTEITGV